LSSGIIIWSWIYAENGPNLNSMLITTHSPNFEGR
jgi:hypothetical protein